MSLFKRAAAHYGKTPEPETPYQKAAQVWDERIGAARVQAKNWRLMAFGCLILAGGFATALVWQSASGTVVPYVVEIDRHGDARFIEEVRSLPADPIVVRQNWLRAYEFTTDRGALALNDHARANDPFTRVGEDQVSVEVSSVIRASPDSFRVAWSERHYENGQLARTERWTAILTIVIDPPRTAERLRLNPLGIYVNAINWSREMSQ